MASKRTKSARFWCTLFTIIHILFMVGPFLYYLPAAFIMGQVIQKLSLGLATILAIIVAAISLVVDVKHRAGLHRTIMWTMIIGVMLCLTNIQAFIWVIAITSVVDELIITRLADHYRTVKNTNKEIDRALNR